MVGRAPRKLPDISPPRPPWMCSARAVYFPGGRKSISNGTGPGRNHVAGATLLAIQIAPKWRCGAAMSICIDWMTAMHSSPVVEVVRTVLLFRVGVLPSECRQPNASRRRSSAAPSLPPTCGRIAVCTHCLTSKSRRGSRSWLLPGSLRGSGQRNRCCCAWPRPSASLAESPLRGRLAEAPFAPYSRRC